MLDASFTQITEKSLIGISENMDFGYNMVLVWGLLKRAACSILTSMWNDEGIRDAFETAVNQSATNGQFVSPVVNAPVKEKTITAPIAQFVAGHTKKGRSQRGCAAAGPFRFSCHQPPFQKTFHCQGMGWNRSALKNCLEAGIKARLLSSVFGGNGRGGDPLKVRMGRQFRAARSVWTLLNCQWIVPSRWLILTL